MDEISTCQFLQERMSLQQTAIAIFCHSFSSKVHTIYQIRTQKKNPYFLPVTKLEKRKNKMRKQPTNQKKTPKKQVLKKSLLIQSTGGALQSLSTLLAQVLGFPKLAFNPGPKALT